LKKYNKYSNGFYKQACVAATYLYAVDLYHCLINDYFIF